MARYRANSPNASGGGRATCHPNLAMEPHILHKSLCRRDGNCHAGAGADKSARSPEHARPMNPQRLNKSLEATAGVLLCLRLYACS